MHSVLSCLVTDEIGPASLSADLVAVACAEYGQDGGKALREYVRAVELTVAALGLKEGDNAIVSPLAPTVYIRAFERFGINAVFADVHDEDACLNPEAVGKALEAIEAKAIFVHAPLGRVPDLTALSEYDLPLIVDIGEALGAKDNEGPLGSGAEYLILPMEPEAIATSGGGTLILAGNKSALKSLVEAADTLSADAFLPDLNASLGIVQWREYPQFLESRDMIFGAFTQALMKGRHRTLANPVGEDSRGVPFSFPVVLVSPMNEVRRYARKKGIETEPAFSGRALETYPEAEEDCPVAKALMMSVLLFPLYPTLGKKNVQHIVKVLSTLP